MASYLRPRRGRKTTAFNQDFILKKGEIFFEVPITGVGTGNGKIKMGDGYTKYSELPYFLSAFEEAPLEFTDTNTPTARSNNTTYLTNIAPGESLDTILTNIKQLLVNYNSQFDTVILGTTDPGVVGGMWLV